MLTYTYYGHSCFLLDDGQYKVLTDPFLTENPLAAAKPEDIQCDFILVSHGHFDHQGQAEEIAKRTGAQVLAIPEILGTMDGINGHGMNVGGTVKLPFGSVKMVPAIHSCMVAGGVAAGFVIEIGGQVVYFAGDTALFSDMKLIGELCGVTVAVLPIGDNFTMGIKEATLAAEFVGAKKVIPIHYNTWPLIAADAEEFKKQVEAKGKATVTVVKPGESVEL
ncbi:MAG: metal-dependent hydrolase [Selenomonadaceae bacterium]|nr:metal-dependent hydrolase [Selenomonadaceae bacterium]